MKVSVSIPDDLWIDARLWAPSKSPSRMVQDALRSYVKGQRERFWEALGADSNGYVTKFDPPIHPRLTVS